MKNNIFQLSDLRQNFISGLIVFLVALPLCLGIAQASNAPLFAGIVSGIIGGIVIGAISGSQLSVSGPAAGLTAIVLGGIKELPSFEIFLCAVVIAGALQIAFGIVRAGILANFIPNTVIEGMLAGIGLTIIIKQLPEAVGYFKQNIEDAAIPDADDGFNLPLIGSELKHIEPAACAIAIIGITILILWQTKAFKKLQMIPAGLLVVLMGVIVNEILRSQSSQHLLTDTHLVSLPVAHSFQEFVGQLRLPNFSGFTNPKVWGLGATIAAVASIETLLCIEATDKMDAQKRYTPTNRELIAQGVGNMLSGFVGGLPMTSVIVRSSANVNAGATSKLSTVIHGVLLLACAASIPALLNLIPKASLAAILIFTGYKLCKPKMFVEMWKSGINRFIPFAVTAIAVPIIGLLDGVALGGAISIIFLLRENYRLPFSYRRSSFTAGELIKIDLAQVVTFLNKAGIKETLYKLPENSSVIIDAGKSEYIDRDALDIIREFSQSVAKDRNIKLSLVGFKEQYNLPKSLSEADVIAHFIDIDEVPALSSGNHKDLMQNLSINN